jgi:hypothetical protein
MVNICESLINVVMGNKRKMLIRLDQTGKWSGIGAPNSPIVDAAPPAERRNLTHTGTHVERGKPTILPQGKASREASRWDGRYGKVEKANATL